MGKRISAYTPGDAAGGDFVFSKGGVTYKATGNAPRGPLILDSAGSFGGIANVKLHGATGDGVTDDSQAVQAAIDSNDVVVLPPGTYRIDTPLELRSGVSIIGYGAKLDISNQSSTANYAIKAAGSLSSTESALSADVAAGTYEIPVTDASQFAAGQWILLRSDDSYGQYGDSDYAVPRGEALQIRSVDTDNNRLFVTTPTLDSYKTADSAKVIRIDYLENIAVVGIGVVGADSPGHGDRGISLQWVNGFSVRDCQIDGVDIYHIEVTNSINGTILNNRHNGVYYDGVNGTIFYAVVLIGATQYVSVGYGLYKRVRHAVTVTSSPQYAGQPHHVVVSNNILHDAEAGGAGQSWAFEQHGFGRYIKFANNEAHGAYVGLNIDAGEDVEVVNNTFTGFTYVGILIGDTANDIRRITVRGNVIDGEVDDGVVSAAYSYGIRVPPITGSIVDLVIDGNVIRNVNHSGSYGIRIGAGATTYGAISVVNNHLVAIRIDGSAVSDAMDTEWGILVEAPGAIVAGNLVHGYANGIYAYTGSSEARLSGNVVLWVSQPSSDGIAYRSAADYVVINGNEAHNARYGVYINTDLEANKVINNECSGCGTPISDNGNNTVKVNNN